MATYQRQSPEPNYQPHRGSLSAGIPPPSTQQGGRLSPTYGYPAFPSYTGDQNPNYDPNMPQTPPVDQEARRPSVPYGPSQPAVIPYTQPATYNTPPLPHQPQTYFPQQQPRSAPNPAYHPQQQPYAQPNYPHPQPAPVQQRRYSATPQASPGLQQHLHPEDSIQFDESTYRRGSAGGPGGSHSNGGGGVYAPHTRPREHSTSSQRSNRSRTSSPYERDDDEHNQRPRDRRRSSYAGSAHSTRSSRSHHSYVDEDGKKHYHRKDKRPTYGDSVMLAWDKAMEFLSKRRS